jgi:hypothetical protein
VPSRTDRTDVSSAGSRVTAGGGEARRPFVALLLADLVSTLGSEMAAVALPWFVLATTGSPARTGIVVGAEFAGVAAFGVPSGRLAARLGPRLAMLLTDGLCLPVALLVPVLHRAGLLGFPVLGAVGLVIGATSPAHRSSQRLLLAATVGDAEVALTRAGGVLARAGGVLGAASFLLVALAVPAPAGRWADGVQRTLDGVRYLLRAPVLRRRRSRGAPALRVPPWHGPAAVPGLR